MEGEAAEVRFVFAWNQTVKVASKMTNPEYTNKKRTSSFIFKHYYFADSTFNGHCEIFGCICIKWSFYIWETLMRIFAKITAN